MKRLENKVSLITGGNSGMGLATAQLFVNEGAKVVITARREEAVKAYNENAAGDTFAVLADINNKSATNAALEKTVKEFGKIDVLFLNAGVAVMRPFEHTDEQLYNSMMGTNFTGSYFTTQAALPFLNDGASIIYNTSIVDEAGMPGMSVYAASKAALRSLVRTLAAELAPRNIRVNSVAPGPIETPLWGKMDVPEEQMGDFEKQITMQVPLGRVGKSVEVANAVLFLGSDEASYITGVELPVDGGMAQV